MSKLHRDNAGYVGCSYEETQDPYYSYNKLALPLSQSDKTVIRDEVTFTVTVVGGKFVIDGTSQATLSLLEGNVYTFDQSHSSNASGGSHPLRFSYTADGTHGGGLEYTLGVTNNGTPGQSGAYVRIVVPFGLHNLKYYCVNHSGMGGSANVVKNTKAFTFGRPILKTTDAFGTALVAPSILFGYDNADNSFDTSGTSVTVDATGYTYNTWSGSQLASALGGVGANSAQVVKASDGSTVTWTISTDTTDRYIFTSSDGQSWSSPGGYYDTDGSTVTITSKWLAWSAGSNSSTTTVSGVLVDPVLDPYAANLVLAIPMNGANNGTTFTDVSGAIRGDGSAKAVTRTGAVTKTDNSIFYGSSGFFDGSGDSLSTPNSSDFNFGSGDFTMEAWIYQTEQNSQWYLITSKYTSSGYSWWWACYGNVQYCYLYPGVNLYNTGKTIPLNTWTHVAVTCKDGIAKLYQNGEVIYTVAFSGPMTVTTAPVTFGEDGDGNYDFKGYMADARIYKGVAKFITPFPTGKYGMDVVNYTGNQSNRFFVLNHRPDFVWIKAKANGFNHQLYDSVRGINKRINSNLIAAEGTVGNSLTAFNSNGFSLGTDNNGDVNGGGPTDYTAWTWKAGGPPTADNSASAGSVPTAGSVKIDGANMTTNLAGTIPAKRLTASTEFGFSVVKYVGTGSAGTIAHGLNNNVAMLFTKNLTGYSWNVFHKSTGAGKYFELETNGTANPNTNIWNNTAPTSDVFTVGTSITNNQQDEEHIAYCWAEIPGFSKFGEFSHDGSSSQTLDFGFKPRWWMVKEHDGTTPWYIFDATRDNFDDPFFANTADNDSSGWGMTFSGTTVTWIGGSFLAGNYIYAAFGESAAGEEFESQLVDQLGLDDLSGNSNNASNAGATWQTSVGKFYDGAADFSSSLVSVPNHEGFQIGSEDFSAECWVYADSSPTSSYGIMALWEHQQNRRSWTLQTFSNSEVRFYTSTDGTNNTNANASTSLPINQWVHLAITKQGSSMLLFKNGNLASSATINGSSTSIYTNTQDPVLIGSLVGGASTYGFDGKIQDCRFYKGIAKYTSSFSPPERSVKGTARRYPSGVYVVS